MPFWARAVFALLLVLSIIIPLVAPSAIGLGQGEGGWGVLVALPIVLVSWVGAEFEAKKRLKDEGNS